MGDEDDECIGSMYSDGHWIWNESKNILDFISNVQPDKYETITLSHKAPTGTIGFNDDIDVLEQMRFRRRYRRKYGPDVITLQDVKDLALYTAPVHIMSPMLIDLLHLPTTERFLRALILSCQYYLQITDEMELIMMKMKNKVRTPESDAVENEYRDNLTDLRLLVAKEYGTLILGGEETKRFHHMGYDKKGRSLGDKDARLFETLLRMCVQIVWLALGRKRFNQIELEIHRLFKTELYNLREHSLKTEYVAVMSQEERSVLLGRATMARDKLTVRSPICDAVFSNRMVDYRLFGLGVIKYQQLSPRLRHLLFAIAAPEEKLKSHGVTVGILGLQRRDFDTMLHHLPASVIEQQQSRLSTSSESNSQSGGIKAVNLSKTSAKSTSASSQIPHKAYSDIHLPLEYEDTYPSAFPDQLEEVQPSNEVQRRRWQRRLLRLTTSRPRTGVNSSCRKT